MVMVVVGMVMMGIHEEDGHQVVHEEEDYRTFSFVSLSVSQAHDSSVIRYISNRCNKVSSENESDERKNGHKLVVVVVNEGYDFQTSRRSSSD